MHMGSVWKKADSVTGSLFCQRVGTHGFGAIARELVKLLQPFDVTISTYSPRVPDSLLEEFGVARAGSLEELFADNEVLIELAPLTPENSLACNQLG